jgi:ketosteroid isomerase-like protein
MQDSSAVLAAAQTLIQAFSRHDTSAYFASFAEQASFIFHNHPQPLSSRAAYQDLWRQWETNHDFRVMQCQSSQQRVQWLGDVALFTHQTMTTVRMDGIVSAQHERESIIFRHDARLGWLAFHEHLSPLPE